MTIGKRIQKHRKALAMSQDDLGQKLFVSRQTISLWENDQTLPTIENLLRLKEIFSISIDELLDNEENVEESELVPKEKYQFHYTKERPQKILCNRQTMTV